MRDRNAEVGCKWSLASEFCQTCSSKKRSLFYNRNLVNYIVVIMAKWQKWPQYDSNTQKQVVINLPLYLAYFEFLARIVTLKPFHPAQFTILGCTWSACKSQTLVDIATLTKVHISLRKSRWKHILFSVKFKSVFQYLTWTPLHVKYLLIAVLSANHVRKNWKTIV